MLLQQHPASMDRSSNDVASAIAGDLAKSGFLTHLLSIRYNSSSSSRNNNGSRSSNNNRYKTNWLEWISQILTWFKQIWATSWFVTSLVIFVGFQRKEHRQKRAQFCYYSTTIKICKCYMWLCSCKMMMMVYRKRSSNNWFLSTQPTSGRRINELLFVYSKNLIESLKDTQF